MKSPTALLAALFPVFCGALLLLTFGAGPGLAGSATWQATPGSGEWNQAGNWSPGTVPNAATDTATFGTSSITALLLPSSTPIELDGLIFNAGASAYTITAAPPYGLNFRGAGITNNSGVTQSFVTETNVGGSYGGLLFYNSATAGTNTAFTNRGSIVPYPWGTGYVQFMNTSNAGGGAFTNEGGTGANSFGGYTQFFDSADAGSATLIANGGVDGGGGGKMVFSQSSTGGTARVEVYGNGFLDMNGHSIAGLTIGSLAGSGNVFLGANKLTVGSNGLSTTFSGVIRNGTGLPPGGGGTGGSLAKIGDGMLTLTGINTYTGVTTVNKGTLSVDYDGTTTFGTLGGAPTTVNGGSGSGGTLQFLQSAGVGSRTFTTNAGGSSGEVGGTILFRDNSSADFGNFTTGGGSVGGTGGGLMQFSQSASAGSGTFTTNGGTADGAGGGQVYFLNSATADYGFFTNNGGAVPGAGGIGGGAPGGYTLFYGTSTAANGYFINEGGTVSAADGGHTFFFENATADQGTFISNGGASSGADGGRTEFYESATAAGSTLVAYGSVAGAAGGSIQFHGNATGGTAMVMVYDEGNLDISPRNATGVTIGSLEGTGNVFLGARKLSVGSNNNSTTFSGVIQDGGLAGGTVGSFAKIGTGTLELTGGSTYTGTTLVADGTLLINNFSGSAFGSGAVTVASGATLAGAGGFTGALALDGILSPGNYGPGTLSAGVTTFGGGGSFLWEINSADGSAGADPGWDLLNISGALNVSATAGNPFTIYVISLASDNTAGELFDFDPDSNSSYALATATMGVGGFDAAAFDLDLTGFQNSYTGTWSVELSGFNDLAVVYTVGAVPEPSTYAALAGLGVLGFVIWRRRRSAAPPAAT